MAKSELKRGLVRILIIGLTNADPLADGILVKFHLTPSKDATEQGRTVYAQNLVATSPDGQEGRVVLIQPTRAAFPERRKQ